MRRIQDPSPDSWTYDEAEALVGRPITYEAVPSDRIAKVTDDHPYRHTHKRFFEAIGGPSDNPSYDLDDGDIVWLVPRMGANCRLRQGHWEVLSLEASSDRLLAADTIKRTEFEQNLRHKLEKLEMRDDRKKQD